MQIGENLHAFFWQSMTANNCNTYLIDGPLRVLIDPGHAALFEHVRRGLADLDLTPEAIDVVVCTHPHPDHIEAARFFAPAAAITMHAEAWQMVQQTASFLGVGPTRELEALTPAFFLQEGSLRLASLDLQVYHTPGHAPGSICLYWPARKALFCGDLIFREGIGRTDLPGGDGAQLKTSILRMAALDVELVLTGHGDILSGAAAVRQNFTDIETYWFRYI